MWSRAACSDETPAGNEFDVRVVHASAACRTVSITKFPGSRRLSSWRSLRPVARWCASNRVVFDPRIVIHIEPRLNEGSPRPFEMLPATVPGPHGWLSISPRWRVPAGLRGSVHKCPHCLATDRSIRRSARSERYRHPMH